MSKDIATCDICMDEFCRSCVPYNSDCHECGAETCGEDDGCVTRCELDDGCDEYICEDCKPEHNCTGEEE